MRYGLYALGLLAVAGCNPYQNLDGDFYLGPVDAKDFQPAYQGAGFDPNSSVGTIFPSYAGVSGGGVVAYYPFPAGVDPLTIDLAEGGGRALVYVFDGNSSADTDKCKKPRDNYQYDARADFVRFDRQGNIFEDDSPAPMPDDPSYVPVYAEVPVASNGEGCNTVHSAEGLVSNRQVTVATGPKPSDENAHAVGKPDGKYLAMAMVDPRSMVLLPDGSLNPTNGLGAERWGFINHLLTAYVEGGVIPTETVAVPDPMGGPDVLTIVAKPATLYAPNVVLDDMGMAVACDPMDPTNPDAPCIGSGLDLIDGVGGGSGARGDAGYSPICSVRTFTPTDPMNPEADPADIDPASLDPDTGIFIYCFQVAQ